ncbi:MAG: hypothetical protein PHV74_09190 [Dehalococcoidia bacterium]|nr:hypothetical protein [Dehalococcoidia bacterium]
MAQATLTFLILQSGGRGSVIVGLHSKGKPPEDTLKVLVSVGSEIKEDGTRVLGPDGKVIEVPLVPVESETSQPVSQ